MSEGVYIPPYRRSKAKWFFIVLLGGWFGLDKLLMNKGLWAAVKIALSIIVGLGVLTNAIEAVFVLFGKYQDDWRGYFSKKHRKDYDLSQAEGIIDLKAAAGTNPAAAAAAAAPAAAAAAAAQPAPQVTPVPLKAEVQPAIPTPATPPVFVPLPQEPAAPAPADDKPFGNTLTFKTLEDAGAKRPKKPGKEE